jgi:hypothetical protein
MMIGQGRGEVDICRVAIIHETHKKRNTLYLPNILPTPQTPMASMTT